jgi:hypothetical protein
MRIQAGCNFRKGQVVEDAPRPRPQSMSRRSPVPAFSLMMRLRVLRFFRWHRRCTTAVMHDVCAAVRKHEDVAGCELAPCATNGARTPPIRQLGACWQVRFTSGYGVKAKRLDCPCSHTARENETCKRDFLAGLWREGHHQIHSADIYWMRLAPQHQPP